MPLTSFQKLNLNCLHQLTPGTDFNFQSLIKYTFYRTKLALADQILILTELS